MQFIVNNAQMKDAEKICNEKFISFSQMMMNAGTEIASRIRENFEPCQTAVICGAGNNGGDGFVIAQSLTECGFKVKVILACGEPKTECAREFFVKLDKKIIFNLSGEAEKCKTIVQNAEIVVDCVFGTGFHGSLPDCIARLFDAARSRPVRISVDVPSGVNSDTGEFDSMCFYPTRTYVLAAFKKCFLVPVCRDLHGETELLDIGINGSCYKEFLGILTNKSCRHVLPERKPSSHKGRFGHLMNIAGSLYYSGAAVMSTRAALRTGVGLCTLATPVSVVKALAGTLVENTFIPLPETADGFIGENAQESLLYILTKASAISVGCGLGNSENTRKMTEYIIKNASCPIIIDADGINSISDNINVLRERTGDTILTPHLFEFSRICKKSPAEIQNDRISAARQFAQEYGVTVVLKGANTVITDGDDVYVNTSGNPGLAKGGSGDVLCGIIAGLAAQDVNPFWAAVCGVYCHGYAADLLACEMPCASILASDIINRLPQVLLPESLK